MPIYHKLNPDLYLGSRTSTVAVGAAFVRNEGGGAGHAEAITGSALQTKELISHLPQKGGVIHGTQRHPLHL